MGISDAFPRIGSFALSNANDVVIGGVSSVIFSDIVRPMAIGASRRHPSIAFAATSPSVGGAGRAHRTV